MLGWELPPHNSGGLGVACLELCKSLASSGADIDFILPYRSNPKRYPFINIFSALPHYSPPDFRFGAYSSNLYHQIFHSTHQSSNEVDEYTEAVAKIAEKRNFDIIHAHDWLTFRAALRAREVSGRPFIAHVHSVERDRAGGHAGNPFVRHIEQTALNISDKVIAVSQRTKDMIVSDYGIPVEKIDVVHNSIDPDGIEPACDASVYSYLEYMKAQGWGVVASIGRLTIQKGLANFIHAAEKVCQVRPKTLFLVVGSGEQRDELIMLAAQCSIGDRVIFTGFLRGKAWRDAYSIADLFVLPSVSEPFGLTALEAIGYGTPVLLTKQCGVSEVICNCLKVDFWDIYQMANKISAVLASKPLAETLHANSYQEYQRLSWNKSVDILMQQYHKHLEVASR